MNSGNTSTAGAITTAGFRGVAVNTGAMTQNQNHKHDMRWGNPGGSARSMPFGWGSTNEGYWENGGETSWTNIDHLHTVTAVGYLYGRTDNTGSTSPFNVATMPPYKIAYCWHRIA